jgi:hypothetical protein
VSAGPGPSGQPRTEPVTDTPLGVKYARVAFPSYQAYLNQLGGGATFYEATWCDIEPKEGTFDWSELDQVADQAKSVGQELMLKIRVGSCWATGGQIGEARGAKAKTASAPPADLAKYDAFVEALVQRYGARGVKEWAIENEINNSDQWAGTPQQYIDLVTHAAGVIRNAQPGAVILDSGISSPTMGSGMVWSLLQAGKDQEALAAYETYFARRHSTRTKDYPAAKTVADLQAIAKKDKWAHNQAVIDATFKLANAHVIDRLQVHFYERWDAVPLLMQFVRQSIPSDMPIEAWEVGLFDVDDKMSEAELSAEVTKTVSQLLAYGAARVLWLPLAADPNGTGGVEKRFGLLEPNGQPRPVAGVFKQLFQVSSGATLRPVIATGLAGFVARRGDQASVVTWAKQGTVDAAWANGAVSTLDGTTPPTTAGGGAAIGASPVLIQVPAAQASKLAGG